MLRTGQVPALRFGETPDDILAMLRTGNSPDAAAGDGGNAGDGQRSDEAGAGGSGATGSDGQPFDADRAQRLIAKLRDENKAAQAAAKERDDLAARLKAIEDKDKTDGEKALSDLKTAEAKLKAAELEAESLKARYNGALIRAAIEREANKLNAIDVETVAALIDQGSVTVDEAGTVAGADKAVAALLKAKPFLVKSDKPGVQNIPGTPDGKGGSGTSREELIAQTKRELQATGLYGRV